MSSTEYVHGYTSLETARLADQAGSLTELLHADTRYPPGSKVLEPGCAVGAQTVLLAANSPLASFTSVDISPESLLQAQHRAQRSGLGNVHFQVADIYALPFPRAYFDHAFVCFLLEHLPDPAGALAALRRVLKPGATITVIEGDHGSAHPYPDSADAQLAIGALVELQRRAGGDALIGRRLYPLLADAGFRDVAVSPRIVYTDVSRPELVDGFTRKTFTAMVEGIRDEALAAGLVEAERFDAGIRDLHRAAYEGTFSYTFFKAVAVNPAAVTLPSQVL
jgi:SAM-dependent methyltransferase